MKNKPYLLLFTLTHFFFILRSQVVTTLDYTTHSWGANGCNIFNAQPGPKVLGGVTHFPVTGGIRSTTSPEFAIVALSRSASTANNVYGTAFRIAQAWQPGYSYTVVVTAKMQSADANVPTFAVCPTASVLDVNTTNPTACDARPNANWQIVLNNNVGDKVIPTTTYSDVTVLNNYTPSTNYNHINFLVFGGQNTTVGYTSTTIRKIAITRRASFTLPATTSILCGSNASKTFTISNNYNTPGVTNYVWQLGQSNGWLYNGTPAPQTITTSTSSISLTPVCGTIQSSVSAAVTAAGEIWNTNSSSITYATPAFAISNTNNPLCSNSAIYSIENLGCITGVTWSVTPATGVVNLSTSGTQATLTRVGNGMVTLTAAISACGSTYNITRNISVGIPVTTIEYRMNGPCNGSYQPWQLTASSTQPVSSWLWAKDNPDRDIIIYDPYGNATNVSVNGGGGIGLFATNACGTSRNGVTVYSFCSSPFSEVISSPNPSKGELTVTIKSEVATENEVTTLRKSNTQSSVFIKRIQVFTEAGILVKTVDYNSPVKNTAKLNLGTLNSGVYTLRITTDKKIYSERIIIAR